MEAAFATGLEKALQNAPEYRDVVNVSVIKALAFNPANANKTYRQLLEEAYGNAITGQRTVETTTPRGGAKDQHSTESVLRRTWSIVEKCWQTQNCESNTTKVLQTECSGRNGVK